ncbi:MAG: hypothetical protein K0U98_16145 [Deltaproteobacteria bacterium]|nr:hypothetical protein [Deltaproteobacteria bacterium]
MIVAKLLLSCLLPVWVGCTLILAGGFDEKSALEVDLEGAVDCPGEALLLAKGGSERASPGACGQIAPPILILPLPAGTAMPSADRSRAAQNHRPRGLETAPGQASKEGVDMMEHWKVLFEYSQSNDKGLEIFVKGQSLAGVVTSFSEEAVEMYSQQFDRIVVRVDRIDAIAHH